MTDNTQPLALMLSEQYDYGDPAAHSNTWKAAVCTELRRQHARIAELEAQLASIGAGGVSGPLIGRAFDAADMATAKAEGFREGAAEMAKLRGQRMVLCSLLGECLPVIDALMQIPGDDDSDAHLNGLAGRITGALNALAEDQVKGGES